MAGWYVVSGSPKPLTFPFQGHRSLLLFSQYDEPTIFIHILVFAYTIFLFFILCSLFVDRGFREFFLFFLLLLTLLLTCSSYTAGISATSQYTS